MAICISGGMQLKACGVQCSAPCKPKAWQKCLYHREHTATHKAPIHHWKFIQDAHWTPISPTPPAPPPTNRPDQNAACPIRETRPRNTMAHDTSKIPDNTNRKLKQHPIRRRCPNHSERLNYPIYIFLRSWSQAMIATLG